MKLSLVRALLLSIFVFGLSACGGNDSATTDGGNADAGDSGLFGDAAVKSCQGTRPDCAAFTSQLTCANAGCTASPSAGSCEGTPAACSTYDVTRCGLTGCTWQVAGATCTGTPTACASVDKSVCGTNAGPAGCTLMGACTGAAGACSTYSTEGACTQQTGCAWQ